MKYFLLACAALVALVWATPEATAQKALNSAEIRELQSKLRDMGYSVAVDGIAGPGTRAALRRFNSDTGAPTGASDRADQDALFRVRHVHFRNFDRNAAGRAPAAGGAAGGAKPSFDCRKAGNAAERAICADGNLAALDRKMAATYRSVSRRVSGANKTRLRREQRGWLAERNRCGGNRGCINNLYRLRLDYLEGAY